MPTPIVVDTRRSPHARLRPVPLDAVKLADPLWATRRALNRSVTLPTQYQQCEQTGRIDNFRRAARQIQGEFQGYFFNDSDVYKWLEAAAWTLAADHDPALAEQVDGLIVLIEAAQETDGYLNTFFTFERATERWSNLFTYHELYCAGHLIQAAIAHQRATGDERLLTVATRFADLICDTFGDTPDKRPGTDGHPEIEMALVELYRQIGDAKYLAQADYFLTARGHGLLNHAEYCQDDVPFRDRHKLAGHAVRAVYLACGAADIYAETGDPSLLAALERVWTHMTTRQMYITGGLGSRKDGEAFGEYYELPNATPTPKPAPPSPA